MSENMNIGNRIDVNVNQSNNLIIEKYCYSDVEDSCNVYGGLYQWDEVMQYTTEERTQGICPSDWHIPTDDEWKELEGSVDSQFPVGDPEWNGTSIRGFDAGLRLKSENGWYSNGNGNDLYGFTGLPSGYSFEIGIFQRLGWFGTFWTSTQASTYYSWIHRLYYGSNGVVVPTSRK